MEREFDFEQPIADIEKALEELKNLADKNENDIDDQVDALQRKLEESKKEVYGNLTPEKAVAILKDYKMKGQANA